ncbi:unnamed protein product [Cyprideis torosa]|uniref:HECT-type E3 ubiquitin transferase n=1 Tax=Cyprideis torosa TaxID=163714 RepID=A0A7R8W417_9CRUS|nr:unnamed protein product [Cyprideis torosa]CAG0879428.1 unnamed protein product [Cyprideis torosa]
MGDMFVPDEVSGASPHTATGGSAVVEAARAARRERAEEGKRNNEAKRIQALARGWLCRRRLQRERRSALESLLPPSHDQASEHRLADPVAFHEALHAFWFFFCESASSDRELVTRVAKLVVSSMLQPSLKNAYLVGMLQKDHSVAWIASTQKLLRMALRCLNPPNAKPTSTTKSVQEKDQLIFLNLLVIFTSSQSWKFPLPEPLRKSIESRLCQNLTGVLVKEGLYSTIRDLLTRVTCSASAPKVTVVHAAALLARRPVDFAEESKIGIIKEFATSILPVPALFKVLEDSCTEALLLLTDEPLFETTLTYLSQTCRENQALMELFSADGTGNVLLSVLGNFFHWGFLRRETLMNKEDPTKKDAYVEVLSWLLQGCQTILTSSSSSSGQSAGKKKVTSAVWHPLLGWHSAAPSGGRMGAGSYAEALPKIRSQLELGWKVEMIEVFFAPLLTSFTFSDGAINRRPSTSDLGVLPPESTSLACPSSSQAVPPGGSLLKKMSARLSNVAQSLNAGCTTVLRSNIILSSAGSTTESAADRQKKATLWKNLSKATSDACLLYQMMLKILSESRLQILLGLCNKDVLLLPLWRLISCLSVRQWVDLFAEDPKSPIFLILILFCDVASHLVTILDNTELFERECPPLPIRDLISIGLFLNQLLFKVVWNGFLPPSRVPNSELFNSCHSLVFQLHTRDTRRPFMNTAFFSKSGRGGRGAGVGKLGTNNGEAWLLNKDQYGCSLSTFIAELNKGKRVAQVIVEKLPHLLPHDKRIVLFRRLINEDKKSSGLVFRPSSSSDSADELISPFITSNFSSSPERTRSGLSGLSLSSVSAPATLIAVHRNRVVEDGYQQLASLGPRQLKATVRVKFINMQGLDEAGIDQDGVFKEFLEEILKQVLDPNFGLFKVTSEGRYYPSPNSHITQDNHLQFFEFVGKMLGKAGILVDVHFATFFLSQIVSSQTSATYSCIDELPSLDPELCKNLTFIKHYDGDTSDLGLSFCFDEESMGQIVSHELIPGGRTIPVTDQNKIQYIHLMAHFRMRTQISKQVAAFRQGFRSIISPDWLSLFSTPDVQRLISGDPDSRLDLGELRKCTQYYGGFHDKHRVIHWLWDILENDFDENERKLFLKFVTSCSCPPLLGFAHLEPPFSIRCVEVGEDEDQGDTLGSVVRGFLTLRKKVNRLPTSSTCFNLLKLPNYQKKTTLKEKLRYAIHRSVVRGFLTLRKKVNRLPTSSTCFNLLKLPNYQKKTTLKEKLRYAIHSNTGFELS